MVKSCKRGVSKYGILLSIKRLGGGTRRLQPWYRRSSIYSSYGKGLGSARKDVDVGRQEGKG